MRSIKNQFHFSCSITDCFRKAPRYLRRALASADAARLMLRATLAVLSLLLTLPAVGAGKTLRIYSNKAITEQIHDVNGGAWTSRGDDDSITELYIGPLGYSCVYGSWFSAFWVNGTCRQSV